MHTESNKVSRSIACQKHLRANSVTGCPGDECGCYDGRLFGLAGDVSGDHTQGEGLSGPEGESQVVADQEADLGSLVVIDDCHEDNGSGE